MGRGTRPLAYRLIGVGVIVSTLSGGTLWWLLLRRHRRAAGRTRAGTTPNPDVVALHKALARMDRKVRAAGPRRGLTETLHAFAQRLRGQGDNRGVWTRIADWYLDYADLRYCRTIPSERLRHLQQRAHRLRHFL